MVNQPTYLLLCNLHVVQRSTYLPTILKTYKDLVKQLPVNYPVTIVAI